MIIEKVVDRFMDENTYILGDEKTKKCAVIDPGGSIIDIFNIIKQHGLTVEYIILTHGHGDHICRVPEIKSKTNAKIVAHVNEEEVLKTIKDCYEDNGYVLDTHTACGYGVLKQYQKETGDQTNTILLSTASPYKFPESVYKALFNEELDVYDAIEKLNEKTGVAVPKPLVGIKDREVLHKTHIDKTEIINFIKSEMEGL